MRVFSFLDIRFSFFDLSLAGLLKTHDHFRHLIFASYTTDKLDKKFQLAHTPSFALGFDSYLLFFLWFSVCLKFTALKIVIR
ncbi:hypothetical protein F896_00458 [Acinetobacter genomosp. 15BJ]|uniref:Uncharacterized protein n=1 Tax=Acinetobacter genomosp. 15BJ TaxID=106651 RepID=R9B7X3_9GAMM|nr:hypothetical protein F896_00458 [Acinetobacter genomosp. 15BJ]